ncbi:MAG: DUF2207 domain-containing protein, partial [Fimbriimonadaceae bacterium]
MSRPRLLCLLLFTLTACLGLAQAPYVIDSFRVEMDLQPSGRMNVTESISVTFLEARRGIYRLIPTEYKTGRGVARRMLLTNLRVTDENGAGLSTLVERDGVHISIRIGDEDVFFQPGTRKTYVIRYQTEGMLNWFGQADGWDESVELYWNITGDQWDTAIRRTEFAIRFPEVPDASKIRARLFYGPLGSTRQQTVVGAAADSFGDETQATLSLSNRQLTGVRDAPMEAYEGLTVVLSLPADTVAKPTFWTNVRIWLLPNIGLVLPLAVLPVLLLAWYVFGRDPHGGAVVVQYDPPENLSPSECGAMVDERIDTRDISAGLVSLAVKGCIDIVPKTEGSLFKRQKADIVVKPKPSTAHLSLFELGLYGALGAPGKTLDESDLRSRVGTKIETLKADIFRELVHRGYYRTSPTTVIGAWGCATTIAIVLLGVFATFLTPAASPLPAVIGGIVALLAAGPLIRGMPRRTALGSKVRSRVLGFEEFIRRARGHEIDWVAKKHPDQALFEEYLPYAIAFGLAR